MIDSNLASIDSLIPHSGSMVLIDQVLRSDQTSLSASLTVRGDGLLLGDEQQVPAWAGLEYMAQAIACYVGIAAKAQQQPVKMGFLLACRNYQTNQAYFKVAETLEVQIEKLFQDQALGVFNCQIQGQSIQISAKLTVYEATE